jgi:hypothetical protein
VEIRPEKLPLQSQALSSLSISAQSPLHDTFHGGDDAHCNGVEGKPVTVQ